jgi:hypothetical protein
MLPALGNNAAIKRRFNSRCEKRSLRYKRRRVGWNNAYLEKPLKGVG